MEHRNIIDYDKLPRYGKETFDGEKTKNHGISCGGRCFVFYVEDRWYQVECEKCGTIAYFRSDSLDDAIRIWNDMPVNKEPCEWCKSFVGKMTANDEDSDYYEMHYCPNCGRKLEAAYCLLKGVKK